MLCACGRSTVGGAEQCERCRRKEANAARWRARNTYEERTCDVCRSEFVCTPKSRRVTCGSEACARERARRVDQTRVKTDVRTCPECGAKYRVAPNSRKSTCGAEACKLAVKRRLDRERKRPPCADSVWCPICGRVVPRSTARQVTCMSGECVKAWVKVVHKRSASRCVARHKAQSRPDPGRGAWGLDVDPWAAGTLDAGMLPREISSYLAAEMLPLL